MSFLHSSGQGYPQVVTWLDNNDVDPLLYCTPLMSVLPRIPVLVNMTQNITTNPFNTQQVTHSYFFND